MTLIYDYALEPELLAECDRDKSLYRYFVHYKKFSWDTGRVVVEYPDPRIWRELVCGLVGNNRRSEALLTHLQRTQIIRLAVPWNDALTWLDNAWREHHCHPFHAILVNDCATPIGHSEIVCKEDILDGTHITLADPLTSITVERTAASMADCIKPMLRYAKRIRFIDPHFDPSDRQYKTSLCNFLRIICYSGRSGSVELEYHASADGSGDDWTTFEGACQTNLSCLIPKGFSITIRRWWNKSGGERFHNRYILTDIGGVHFGNSIKEEPKGIDTISRLSSIDSLKWNAKYSDGTSAFDLDGEVTIPLTPETHPPPPRPDADRAA